MAYLLDSSVFITAKRVHYGFDFCPGFWDWIVAGHAAGRVYSIKKVHGELQNQQDDLADWAKALPDSFFVSPGPDSAEHFATVSSWANGQNYHVPAITTFMQTADYYLVAQAIQGCHTVVTYEVPGGSQKRIKIPDACLGVGVKCVLPHDLLRQERAKFVCA